MFDMVCGSCLHIMGCGTPHIQGCIYYLPATLDMRGPTTHDMKT